MAGRKPNATVCGVPTSLGGAVSYGGGHLTTGIGKLGHWRAISKPGAKRLLGSLFGHKRLPRPGHGIKLCGDQYLENISGSYQVRKRGSGEISGRRRLGDNSPTSTRSEVRSPTSTSTEVRSPTSTATDAFTSGNVTVTGGAGKGATVVHVYGMPNASAPRGKHTGNARRQEVKQALRTRAQERADDRRGGVKPRATDKPKRRR